MDPHLSSIHGRGTAINPANRFEGIAYALDEYCEVDEEERPAPHTQFFRDSSKSILAKNDSPDIPFKYSLNPYRGCEHGCVYCYARPMHEYLGFSAGLDFETRIMVKENAPELLRAAFTNAKWEPQTIALSGATDCYQPIERTLRLTQRCLEVFAEFKNPVAIITKNRLVTRDIELLKEMARDALVCVNISVTTLRKELNRVLEPRTSMPQQRLDAIQALAEAGIPVGVLVAPIIPGLNDEEVPSILAAAADAGAESTGYVVLRLPHAVAPIFEQWLTTHMPDRKNKILSRVRSLRGGQLYDAKFGQRMKGEGVFAEQIANLFRVARRHAGFPEERTILTAEHFRRPATGQMSLFD